MTVPSAWLDGHAAAITAQGGDREAYAQSTAANGRKVWECYVLGIDPEDPDDDLRITSFEMRDGKPVVTLNHTEDGSGESFVGRIRICGKAELSDAEWVVVPEAGNPALHFFRVEVVLP